MLIVSTVLVVIISLWRIESVQNEKDYLESELENLEVEWFNNYYIEMDVLIQLFFNFDYNGDDFIGRITGAYPEIQKFWEEFSLEPEMLSAVVITEETEDGENSIYIDSHNRKIIYGYPENITAYLALPGEQEAVIQYMNTLPRYFGTSDLKKPFIRISGKSRTCLILLDYNKWRDQFTDEITAKVTSNPTSGRQLFSLEIQEGGQELADEIIKSESNGYPLTSLRFDSGGYGGFVSESYDIPEIYTNDASLNYSVAARVRMSDHAGEEASDPFDPGNNIEIDGISVWAVFSIDKTAVTLEALRIQLGAILLSYAAVVLLIVLLFILAGYNRRTAGLMKEQQTFIANVSHELRTPLAVICNAGTNLSEGFVTESEHIQKYGKMIVDEGRRLSGMVEGILMYSGFQLGKINKTVFQVDELAELLIRRFSLLCREKGIRFESKIEPGLMLNADREGVLAAISNLLQNATVHGDRGGYVRLTIRESSDRHFSYDRRFIEVKVSDNGPGISKNEQKKIFDPFIRGCEADRLAAPGSGLGLSLVKQVAELHGGSVTITSLPGEGTEFILRLVNEVDDGENDG